MPRCHCPRERWRTGSRFELATGRVLNLPATVNVQTYPVNITDESMVRICLDEE